MSSEARTITFALKLTATSLGRVVAQIIAEEQADPHALAGYRDRFLYPRRAAAKATLFVCCTIWMCFKYFG